MSEINTEKTDRIIKTLAKELGTRAQYVANVVSLIDEGNTIPFIARYRKEMHGAMDDTALRTLAERLTYLRNLDERKDAVLKSIEEQGKLTEELKAAIEAASTQTEVEDLYRPYKQKKRTRATIAKEKGLEPLAFKILLQGRDKPEDLAAEYMDPEKGVETIEDALAGASDIIAEIESDDADNRKALKEYLQKAVTVCARAAKEEDSVYRTYYEFNQAFSKMAGHQTLAINRGEKEGFLKVTLEADQAAAKELLAKRVIARTSPSEAFLRAACEDSYDRLIWPSLERELRSQLTDAADEGAIHNFALNLKPLLMQPPVKGSVVMGLDPGYRNGCKVAVVDETGKVLDTAVVYPTFNEARKLEAIRTLSAMARRHGVKHLAIGNGTASREMEAMAVEMIRGLAGSSKPLKLSYAMVNEAGASVYSASKLAAEEFPDYDVTLRSAVSIA
ncbi:MAG: RNA-binding transcriptional accessory protein, partial [Firmicutes bacterium]|nr:RNA-binding transcriptional accessory protein [Bacillota bacterium]